MWFEQKDNSYLSREKEPLSRREKITRIGGVAGVVGTTILCLWLLFMRQTSDKVHVILDDTPTPSELPADTLPPPADTMMIDSL